MAIKMISLILGGGAGTRLFPLTKDRSKPAVPIGGKYRLIDIPISNCLNSGLRRMFVLTQFNSASLNQHIKNTFNFDLFTHGFVDILAAEQTPSSDKWYQGTADAVRQSMHHFTNHDFDYILILSGDQLYQMDFEKLAKYHIKKQADVTIATIPVGPREAPSFGIMKVGREGYIQSFVEKPASDTLHQWESEVSEKNREEGNLYLASMGIYIFNRNALRKLFDDNKDAIDFGKQIIPDAIQGGYKVASYEFDGYWTDIGHIYSFYEANIELTDAVPKFNLFDDSRSVYTRPRLLAPSKIFGTQMNSSVVAEGSIIHASKIERSVVGIRSRIGENTVISYSVVMGADFYETITEIEAKRGVDIPMGIGSNCHIEKAIIDKNVRIGDNVVIKGGETLENTETEHYCIKDGIVVVKKNARIESGTKIGDV
jgi:glucose-1-phosphate adenylyltransferase